MPRTILACIDAPDPDNFALLHVLAGLFRGASCPVAVTGRPVVFAAGADTASWDYDLESSLLVQKSAAARITRFCVRAGSLPPAVYDGGIAPRSPVPHHRHIGDHLDFRDHDPVAAIRRSDLRPQEDLVGRLSVVDSFSVAVGGPFTGLAQLLTRAPALAAKIDRVAAMFATWGDVDLMPFGDTPRGAVQFNAACDPVAADFILNGLPATCRLDLMPTEVTRRPEIGFLTEAGLATALAPASGGLSPAAVELLKLYAAWYPAVVRPRQEAELARGGPVTERIYLHDVVAAFALDPALRDEIYEMVPVHVERVVHRPNEPEPQWGTVVLRERAPDAPGNVFAAKGLRPGGAAKYLASLRRLFA